MDIVSDESSKQSSAEGSSSTQALTPDREAGTAVRELCTQLLLLSGEDPKREGLLRTPMRFEQAMQELTEGYHQDINQIINGAIFEEDFSQMVLVKDIEFFSLCEHHLLPFFGKAHVAYIPRGKIIGVSKIPRIVQMFSRRLQVQERLTEQIAQALDEALNPLGVGCIIEGLHMCMMMRGIQTQTGIMVTNSMRGCMLSDRATRDEFLKLVSHSSR
ncbi:MAG: GTP cyclohydrolase I FolE [Bdellovibrionota bacterium]